MGIRERRYLIGKAALKQGTFFLWARVLLVHGMFPPRIPTMVKVGDRPDPNVNSYITRRTRTAVVVSIFQ
jgi:hypothetical protein